MKRIKMNQLYAGTLVLALIALLFSGCKKEEQGEDGRIPESLKNVSVENIPGGAIISYEAPTDGSAVLVTAVYPTEDGGKVTLRFALTEYTNEFTLKGLTMEDRTVELYTVSASGNKSASVEVEIQPLLSLSLAYLNTVLESVVFEPIPSGVSFSFQNAEEKSLSFILSKKDENNEWKEYKVFQSQTLSEVFRVDDFLSPEIRLQIEDTDSEERSSRQDYAVEYLEEILLDKSKWANKKLDGDIVQHNSHPFKNLWDNNYIPGSVRFESIASLFPQRFTIDLGENQNLRLTKIKVHQFASFNIHTYGNYNPKTFEIWGSNSPASDGTWEGWEKIADCESFKPSGSPYSTVTEADYEYAKAGEIYNFPLESAMAYRYIRFKILNTWGVESSQAIRLYEVTLWGVE